MACARRTISDASAEKALGMLRQIEKVDEVRALTDLL